MTFSTRIFNLTILLGLTFFLAACGSATPTAVLPTDEPAPTSEPLPATAAAETVPAAEAPEATETSSVPAPETGAPAGGTVSFSQDVMPILERTCTRCHGGSRREEGLDMRTYAAVLQGSQNGPVIIPGDAEASFLITQIVTGEMPRRAPRLPAEQVQILIDWVNQGALDN
jgi:hypothetical protein